MELTALCHHCDGWWAIEVPEIDGLHSQARRLDQVPAMVVDAASLFTDRPESDFTVTVIPQLPTAGEDKTMTDQEYRVIPYELPQDGIHGYIDGTAITDDVIARLNASAEAGHPGVVAGSLSNQ